MFSYSLNSWEATWASKIHTVKKFCRSGHDTLNIAVSCLRVG